MVDTRLKIIADVLRGYTGECICHEGYAGRNLVDPDCTYHLVPNEEAAADIIAALDKAAPEVPEDNFPPIWNVFLFDPNNKYGDVVTHGYGDTAEEAERDALSRHPGTSVARESVLSPYGGRPKVHSE